MISEPDPGVGESRRTTALPKPSWQRDQEVARAVGGSPDFQALTEPGFTLPPDTNGAVGVHHVMTMLNSEVRIQDKAGNVLAPDVSLLSFWAATGAYDVFDPKLVYDHYIDRWLTTCDADRASPESAVLFAVSGSSDPTGTWTFYRFDADNGDTYWSDFPDLGFNVTWIGITNNMFRNDNFAFGGAAMWVIVKNSNLLSGGELTVATFGRRFDSAAGYDGYSLSPCVTHGNDPFGGAYLYIVDNSGWVASTGTPLMRISRISGTSPETPTWTIVPGAGIAGSGLFPVDNAFVNAQKDAPQLGSEVRIQTNDSRMLNAVYRSGSIWCTHTGGLPFGSGASNVNRTAAFWYQIDPFLMPLPIIQSGVLDGGPGVHHFFPSITVNAAGEAFIGFSRSDSTRYVEAAYAQRSAADPPGLMGPVTVFKEGEASYEKGGSSVRWGDYSSTVVDPADDLAFWTIQEYAAADVGPGPLDDRWGTWWASSGVKINGACCVDGDCAGVMGFSDCRAQSGSLFIDEDCLTVTCPCPTPEAATMPDPLGHAAWSKNRFLTVVPGNPGELTALRVTLSSSAVHPSAVGSQWWVGPPQEVCENSGQGPGTPAGSCGPAPGIPRRTLWWSELACSPTCLDWQSLIDIAGNALDVLHIGDPDIATSSTYVIEAVNCECAPADPASYSAPLDVDTGLWGDTTHQPPAACPRTEPNGAPIDLILDCVGILNKFSNLNCALIKSRADLEPYAPDLRINISDVSACVNAFSGDGYPYPSPVGCSE